MALRCFTKFIMFAAIVLLLPDAASGTAQIAKCPEGTYFHHFRDMDSLCVECPHGTFMPWKNHIATKCFDCTKIENSTLEILITPCNRVRDADIQCVDGHFRRQARNPRDKPSCRKCTPTCPLHHFPVHPCQNFSDLGCCPGENYDYYIGEGGIRMCRERPWMCRIGQYLDIQLNDCKSCPENTFMSDDYHSHTNCWDCHYSSEADLPLHAVILRECTSTQPPQYGCVEGFYMNHGMSYRGDDIGCSPCQTCDKGMYVAQQCDMYHDTVCCEKSNMTVVDEPNGGLCINVTDDLRLFPSVETLRVQENSCQSVTCYIALMKGRRKPELTWVGPNVDKHQQFRFEKENKQTGVTVFHNTVTICDFSAADKGTYTCKDSLDSLSQVARQLDIQLACKYGTYNPPDCDKKCSQHCRKTKRSEESVCDYNNGDCRFGCIEGYKGAMCELRQEDGPKKRDNQSTLIGVTALCVVVIVLIPVIVIFIRSCPGSGPKWWQKLVQMILPQKARKANANLKDTAQQTSMTELDQQENQPECETPLLPLRVS